MQAAMSTQKDEKKKMEAKLFRRLQARERLHQLADNPDPKTPEDIALERLRAYLRDWRGSQPAGFGPGGESGSTLGDLVKGSPEAMEMLAESDGWAMAVIDASVDDLTGVPEVGALMRAALRVRWLNEGVSKTGEIKIRVFRSGRLQALSLIECDELADRAERALLPIVRRRGLPV